MITFINKMPVVLARWSFSLETIKDVHGYSTLHNFIIRDDNWAKSDHDTNSIVDIYRLPNHILLHITIPDFSQLTHRPVRQHVHVQGVALTTYKAVISRGGDHCGVVGAQSYRGDVHRQV